jgi:hypothetical protein
MAPTLTIRRGGHGAALVAALGAGTREGGPYTGAAEMGKPIISMA